MQASFKKETGTFIGDGAIFLVEGGGGGEGL